jgi:hypothetical protein
VYIDWGNDLLEQKQFQAAIEKFDLAVARAEADKDDGARAASINGRIQWASDLSAAEDFTGALEQLGFAQEAATTDPLKETVNTALEETYVAFSASTGKQAQRAMQNTLRGVCERDEEPELPIFGLDKDALRVGIFGADVRLPENLVARTPGEMHYFVCIDVEEQIVDSRFEGFRQGNWIRHLIQYRIQLFWNVSLLKSDTGDMHSQTTLAGKPAPPYATKWEDLGTGRYIGEPPSVGDLVEWLQSVME